MNKEELDKILEAHKHWLNVGRGDGKGMCACLSYTDLSYTDLHGENLIYADLRGVNLAYANLAYAHLENANLENADLSHANLRYANLTGAILRGANLNETELIYTNLRCADLAYANLENADLSHVNLICADLSGAKNLPFIPLTCPDTGAFIGYKKASGKIVKLLILPDARRSSSTGRKCRCSKALVLQIQNLDGTKADHNAVISNFDKNFVYEVGKVVEEPRFDEDRWKECAPGIHFFTNREEAVEYI